MKPRKAIPFSISPSLVPVGKPAGVAEPNTEATVGAAAAAVLVAARGGGPPPPRGGGGGGRAGSPAPVWRRTRSAAARPALRSASARRSRQWRRRPRHDRFKRLHDRIGIGIKPRVAQFERMAARQRPEILAK